MKVPIVWENFEGSDGAKQWVTLADGRFKVMVAFGVGRDPRGYSEVRSLMAAHGGQLNEGDVVAIYWTTETAKDLRLSFPKQDQQEDPTVNFGPFSIVEVHHGPLNGDWNSAPYNTYGSAPIYTFMDQHGHGIIVPSIGGRPGRDYDSFHAPLELGRKNAHSLMLKASPDPKVGWLAYLINNQWVVGGPGKPHFCATMYPGCFNYILGGIYSRLSIGDPNLLWYTDPKPGAIYPQEFVPKKGSRVYPLDDGYPRVLIFGEAFIESLPDTAVVPPPPPAPEANVDINVVKKWRQQLMDTRDDLLVSIQSIKDGIAGTQNDLAQKTVALKNLRVAQASMQALIDSISQLLDHGGDGGIPYP